ncbi:MAG TPA: Xaa-Pro peptidase family protein [Verrucomicrobiae bacterium]
MSKENLLIVADSERDANMLYAVRMFVPDAFIYLKLDGVCHVVMSDLEIDRARKTARHCKVHSLTEIQSRLKKSGVKRPGLAQIIRALLKENGTRKISVPPNFPYGLARQLRDLNLKLKVWKHEILPDRELKDREEVKKISAALIMAEVGLSEGIQAIKRAKVGKNRRLVLNNSPLTSERLRAIIDTAIIQAGGFANHTIVSCGNQACDPHERGSGPLKANLPVIIDVFPRSQKTGYFGDITRTVVKGRAPDAIRKMYHSIAQGQEIALAEITHGASGKEIHLKVNRYFESQGFKTGKHNGRMQGFFHGTGHGVGLEIHEAPRISKTSTDTLRAGHVVTIEPGLYYPGIGGVRLEDMAYVTRNGPKNLTKFEKVLEV